MCAQVQEGPFAVRFRFDGKLDVVVNAVDVPGEPFHVILMDLTYHQRNAAIVMAVNLTTLSYTNDQ